MRAPDHHVGGDCVVEDDGGGFADEDDGGGCVDEDGGGGCVDEDGGGKDGAPLSSGPSPPFPLLGQLHPDPV